MLAWSFYTLNLRDWPALGSSLGPLLCWFATLVLLSTKYKEPKGKQLLLSLPLITLIIFSLPTPLQGSLAVTGSLLWGLPQLKKAFTHSDLTGISILSYTFILLENLCWIIYALLTGHLAYAYAPLVQGPIAIIIALRAYFHARSLNDNSIVTLIQK